MRLVPLLITLLRLSAVLLPVAGMVVWLQLESSVHFAFERICRDITPSDVGWLSRGLGAFVGTGHLALLAWALISLASFFKEGNQGAYLSEKAVTSFRHFANLFFLFLITTPLVNIFSSQVLTNGIAITVNTDDLKLLGCGVILLAVSRTLGVARIAKDENESFL